MLATFKVLSRLLMPSFVKADGSTRYFWGFGGVLKSEERDPKNIVTAYDFRKKDI